MKWSTAAIATAAACLAAPALAWEPILPPVDSTSLVGEWEAAWKDTRHGQMLAVLLQVRKGDAGRILIVHEPSIGIVEDYLITSIDLRGESVAIAANGIGKMRGATVRIDGVGGALPSEGVMKGKLHKTYATSDNDYDVNFVKVSGGFFSRASRMLNIARKRAAAVIPQRMLLEAKKGVKVERLKLREGGPVPP